MNEDNRMDKGKWKVTWVNALKSDDPKYSAVLEISGNLGADAPIYAEWLARELNDCPALRAIEEKAGDVEGMAKKIYAQVDPCPMGLPMRVARALAAWLKEG